MITPYEINGFTSKFRVVLKVTSKGLITLSVISITFLIFSRVFTCVFDTSMYEKHENARKTQEKRMKITQCEPNARKCFYITLCVGYKREPVTFFSRFSRAFAHSVTWAS